MKHHDTIQNSWFTQSNIVRFYTIKYSKIFTEIFDIKLLKELFCFIKSSGKCDTEYIYNRYLIVLNNFIMDIYAICRILKKNRDEKYSFLSFLYIGENHRKNIYELLINSKYYTLEQKNEPTYNSRNIRCLTFDFKLDINEELQKYIMNFSTKPNMPNIPTKPNMPNIPTKPNMPNIPTKPNMPNIPTKKTPESSGQCVGSCIIS
jgi:hypothetical protein